MKKSFLLIVLTIAGFSPLFSQARFGLHVGGNMSFTQFEIDGNDDLSNKGKFGITGGFLADIPMGR
ncbi:MAG: hypothetical protein QM737_15790 [Ferruginibacter sp.]